MALIYWARMSADARELLFEEVRKLWRLPTPIVTRPANSGWRRAWPARCDICGAMNEATVNDRCKGICGRTAVPNTP